MGNEDYGRIYRTVTLDQATVTMRAKTTQKQTDSVSLAACFQPEIAVSVAHRLAAAHGLSR